LASGTLKLTLTGHISSIRGLAVSDRSPYLFSAGEDKMVRCWDLEYNRVIRDYHGHLSGVYCLSLHPTLDLLCTGVGRTAHPPPPAHTPFLGILASLGGLLPLAAPNSRLALHRFASAQNPRF
jgi:hypothetical protein